MNKNIVVPFKDGRFAIANEEGKVIDDAQGYGYKTKQKAYLAMNWKFGGGKEKADLNKKMYNTWLKESEVHPKIIKAFDSYMECCFKELARGETKMSDIWKEIENEFSVSIPDYVKKQVLK